MTEYRTVVASPPKQLLTDCPVSPPPSKNQFLNALLKYPELEDPWEARTLLLKEHWSTQTNNLLNCNKKKQAVRDWYIDQEKKGVSQ